jgi:hypothetical protein
VYVGVLGECISNGRSTDLSSGVLVSRADPSSSEPKTDKNRTQCESK